MEVADGFTFPSWESAFRALADLPMQPRPVVVLDEFTYLISGNKAIPSILQKVWDERTFYQNQDLFSNIRQHILDARYLDILQQMHLVVRRVPATECHPEKSKKGLYQIDDHFLRFWFRYVHPNQSELDLGLADVILTQRIRPDLDHFVASAFEEASQAFVARLARSGQLDFIPERIGGWWDRDAEIDVLAINQAERVALVGECKWSVHPVGINVLEDLKRKTAVLQQTHPLQKVSYALFSRAGFTSELKDLAISQQVGLYILEDLFQCK